MGKFLLILMLGLSVSSGIIVISKNRQLVDSSQLVAEQFANSSAKNAANSGAILALNHLYRDDTWRPSYGILLLNKDTIYVAVQDTAVPANQLKILTKGANKVSQKETEVMVFDGDFHDFAVWAKDSVAYVTTSDSNGVVDSSLVVEHAPFMPYIDYDNLVNEAVLQLHIHSGGGHFHPSDGYPFTGSFYYSGLTPNVTWVDGDLHVQTGNTVYGIYIVEGETLLDGGVTVEGIIYMPNSGTLVSNRESATSNVNGGIITWGAVNGNGYQIYVEHDPEYMQALASNYAPNNPRMRVLSWK